MKMNNKKAFTLVELSIVLIVIGLLSGAILKGQEIIKGAKLKRILSDFSNLSTAIYTYEDRYDAMPGDDSSSVIGTSIISGGDENGVIDFHESEFVFMHLRKAGIISGDKNNGKLNHALGGAIHVVQGSQAAKLPSTIHNMADMAGTAVCFENIKAEDASIIDGQNDDKKYKTGIVQGSSDYTNESLVTICLEI